jgi:ubiquitin thioesterase OTU1
MSQVTIPEDATWGDLKVEISSKTSVPDFDIKYGYPPKPLDTTSFGDDLKLTDIGINLAGEQLIIMPRDISSKLSNPMAGSAPNPIIAGTLPTQSNASVPKHQPGDFPSGQHQTRSQAAPLSLARKPNDVTEEPPEVPVPGLDGVMILRVMPDDNSCMFRALGSAVLGNALDGMNEVSVFRCMIETRR